MTGRRQGSRGQALAEFALVAPLFFLLLFGIIEFGRAVYTLQILNNASREGARYAIVHGAKSTCPSGPMPNAAVNNCDPSGNRVKDATVAAALAVALRRQDVVVLWCNPAAINACTTAPGNGTNDRNQTVIVRTTLSYRPLIPLVPLPNFTLTGGSTLVVNH